MKKLNLDGIGQILSKNQMKKVIGGYTPDDCLYCSDGNCYHGGNAVPDDGMEACAYYHAGSQASSWNYCGVFTYPCL